MEEMNKSLELLINIKEKKIAKFANTISWLFSNLFSLIIPVSVIFLIECFEKNGSFNFKNSYSEMLMVTISINMNLIIQLNSKDYKTGEVANTLIRVITVGVLVIASLAYGISKTIPENELNINPVFTIAIILVIYAFIVGAACESTKKERN